MSKRARNNKKKKSSYTRSSCHSLKYANKHKREIVNIFIEEYRKVSQIVIDDLWETRLEFQDSKLKIRAWDLSTNKLRIPSFLPSEYLNKFKDITFFSARMLQCLGKQVCGMLGAATEKRRKQLYMLKKLQRENQEIDKQKSLDSIQNKEGVKPKEEKKKKDVKYLQRKIDKFPLVKPNASRINIEMDSRFIDFLEDSKHFDMFVKISTIGDDLTLTLPIKHTKVSNKWLGREDKREKKDKKKLKKDNDNNKVEKEKYNGKLKTSIRLTPNSVILIFDVPKPEKKTEGRTTGCDQGIITCATMSDGQVTKKCPHGHDLTSIQDKLKRKKPGSKAFKEAQEHRTNYINWSIKQLSFQDVKQFNLEGLSDMGRGVNTPRFLNHWAYIEIKDRFFSISEEKGFQFTEVPNEFRSQRCNSCGWVRKVNRKGKTFNCSRCGNAADADLNAASNLELDLFKIPFWVRSERINRKGFFWNLNGIFSESWEPIVPNIEKGKRVE